MKRRYPVEFVYQALSLIISLLVVHAFFVTVVRPRADAILADRGYNATSQRHGHESPVLHRSNKRRRMS